jgi:hypothetical protein
MQEELVQAHDLEESLALWGLNIMGLVGGAYRFNVT